MKGAKIALRTPMKTKRRCSLTRQLCLDQCRKSSPLDQILPSLFPDKFFPHLPAMIEQEPHQAKT
jgi:hypothetical protein